MRLFPTVAVARLGHQTPRVAGNFEGPFAASVRMHQRGPIITFAKSDTSLASCAESSAAGQFRRVGGEIVI